MVCSVDMYGSLLRGVPRSWKKRLAYAATPCGSRGDKSRTDLDAREIT